MDSALRRSFSFSRDMCEVALSEKSRGKHQTKSPETAHVRSLENPQTQHACRMTIGRQCSGEWKQSDTVKWRRTYGRSPTGQGKGILDFWAELFTLNFYHSQSLLSLPECMTEAGQVTLCPFLQINNLIHRKLKGFALGHKSQVLE